jgi:hypothetical protein
VDLIRDSLEHTLAQKKVKRSKKTPGTPRPFLEGSKTIFVVDAETVSGHKITATVAAEHERKEFQFSVRCEHVGSASAQEPADFEPEETTPFADFTWDECLSRQQWYGQRFQECIDECMKAAEE